MRCSLGQDNRNWICDVDIHAFERGNDKIVMEEVEVTQLGLNILVTLDSIEESYTCMCTSNVIFIPHIQVDKWCSDCGLYKFIIVFRQALCRRRLLHSGTCPYLPLVRSTEYLINIYNS